MRRSSGVFVKLNYKSMGETKSLIIDRQNDVTKESDKYLMCAGKYDKSGWTLVFKARNIEEAELLINNNPFKNSIGYNAEMYNKPQDRVEVPAWLS